MHYCRRVSGRKTQEVLTCALLVENVHTNSVGNMSTYVCIDAHIHTHTHTPKRRAILILASLPGVLTHSAPGCGSLMMLLALTQGKCNGFVFIS